MTDFSHQNPDSSDKLLKNLKSFYFFFKYMMTDSAKGHLPYDLLYLRRASLQFFLLFIAQYLFLKLWARSKRAVKNAL